MHDLDSFMDTVVIVALITLASPLVVMSVYFTVLNVTPANLKNTYLQLMAQWFKLP
jgi:hypothetical protein